MARDAARDERIRQDIDHVDRLELAGDPDRQAFMGELVDDVEHAEPASLVGAILDKVVGPDVVGMLRAQPDTRPIGEPKTASFGLLVRDLQSLTFPDPLNSTIADRPTEDAEDYKAFEEAYDAQSASSASLCCDWRAYCGGSVAPRP